MTSTERRRTWSERLDPRNWSLVVKLAVVGLVPTVLALTIGAVRVVDQADVAEQLGQGSGLVDAHQRVDELVGALQAERAAAVTYVAGNRLGDRNAVDSAQATTDQALQRANDQLGVAEQQAPQLATARRQADTTLGQIPVIRSQVSTAPTPALDVTTRYTAVVARTLALDRALLGQLQTSDTAGLASALGATANAGEALELERSVLDGAIASGQLEEAQKALVNGAEASYQSAAGDFAAALTPQQADRFGNFAADPANADRQGLRDTIMATPTGSPVAAAPAAWNAAVDRSAAAVRASDRQAEDQFIGGRAQAAEAAGNTAGLNSVLLMLGLLLTIGIILLLGRQLVRSLRVLRTSALDVAERKLPQAVQGMRAGQAPSAMVEPVPLEGRDEIGEVARAFDAVHGQAIRLAADQAALQQNVNSMFVNLSRRSQALVERQLQLIEQLESNEQDPDQLSNLFQLDHLATRMRRNSENLLVLAGTDLAKRNVAPVQVVDVLRAAVSEVEQYQRVVVQTPPTATIAGRAANDLVHLLAELLDNATNFSPPDSQVVMSTIRTSDESLLIEISDRGVGMADADLADANQRLSGPAEVDVSASRRMGLFVVGRLAARHRVGVRLSSASAAGRSGGLSASVTIPPQLVPSGAPVEMPREPRGESRSSTGAWPVPAPPAAPAATNGAARDGDRSSTVAGADGPTPPTFGAGRTGPAAPRNGSAPKLPTRTPGSALRSNSAGPSDPNAAPNGQESASNGSAPSGATTGTTGISAFSTSGTGSDGGPLDPRQDVFTPATDKPGSVFDPADGPAPGTRDGRRPSPDGRSGTGSAGPTGPAGRERSDGGAEDRDDDRHGATAEFADAPDDANDPEPGDRPGADRTSGSDAATGATGAIGLAGGATLAAAAAARMASGTDSEDTTRADATRSDDDARDTDTRDADARDARADLAAEPSGEVERSGSSDGPDIGADVATPDTTDVTDVTDDVEDTDHDGTDDTGLDDDTEDETLDPVAAADGDHDAADEPAGTGEVHPTGSGPDEDHAPADPEEWDDQAAEATGAIEIVPAPVNGSAPAAPVAPSTASGPADDGAQAEERNGQLGSRSRRPDPDEHDTAVFPAVRPPREPMGGGSRPSRTERPRPAPARRPVMPGPTPGTPVRNGASVPQDGPPAGDGSRTEDVEELFAPAVPVEGDRGQLRRPGGLETARSGSGYDISQTTPIFEEIASAWFRSNRSVPVRWQDAAGREAPGQDRRAPDANGVDAGPGRAGSTPRPSPSPAPRSSAAELRSDADEPADDSGFASPADEVWRQAAAGTDTTERPDEMTAAGLPKRRPRARLLPGSAAGSTVLSPPAAEARSADTVRGRLASYQQGVRQGRENAAGRAGNAGPDGSDRTGDRPNSSDHEENT